MTKLDKARNQEAYLLFIYTIPNNNRSLLKIRLVRLIHERLS
jgi:hypothetical protein